MLPDVTVSPLSAEITAMHAASHITTLLLFKHLAVRLVENGVFSGQDVKVVLDRAMTEARDQDPLVLETILALREALMVDDREYVS